jgi:uncharacterized protein (TIGR02271 family)
MNTDITHLPVSNLLERTVVDPDGDKVGTVFDVYVDDDTNEPEWLAVSTGMFGTKISFVPLDNAAVDGDDRLLIAYSKDLVKDAPRAEADGQLSEDEERALYAHYGRTYATPQVAAPVGTSAPRESEGTMVRSEEELTVEKRERETGRVRLRKWVETENVQLTVPVKRQMARVVREAARPGDEALETFGDDEQEIVLSEEVVDVDKHVVPKERVRLETDVVESERVVDGTVRKERVEMIEETGSTSDRREGGLR